MSSKGRSQSQLSNDEQSKNNTIKDYELIKHHISSPRRTSISKEGLDVASLEFSSRRGSEVSF